jgi:energy-converting hydrogenase B subunit D
MIHIIPLILAAIGSTLALAATLAALVERDVLKSIVIAGLESVFLAFMLIVFLAPDLLIAYIAVGLGLNSIVLIYALMRGDRYEEER